MPTHDPLDDWFPIDETEHAAQLDWLTARLTRPARILDLGAGDGRIAGPLAEAGHEVIAIDSDPRAIERLAARAVNAVRADFMDPAAPFWADAQDCTAVLCLGNTFMTVSDPAAAVALMKRIGAAVGHGGFLAIDDFCTPLWREVAEGYWQNGVSEDGAMQMIWHPRDNVLSLRTGADVDEDHWEPRASDTALRLWSQGELALLAAAGGWRTPYRAGDALLIFEPERAR